MKKSVRKTLENKLDDLWRKVGKEEAYCEVCATLPRGEGYNYTKLDPHHMVGRGRLVRWLLRNRVWLCSRHHTLDRKSAHKDGTWFDKWCWKHRRSDFIYLRKLKGKWKKWRLEELENFVKELEAL